MKKIKEDGGAMATAGGGPGAPANNVGSGHIAGIDPPAVMLRRKKYFAGHKVFEVDGDRFEKARLGKKKYLKYETYVGNDDIGEEIRQYGRENPSKPIILQHEQTGQMCFLRYGKDRKL